MFNEFLIHFAYVLYAVIEIVLLRIPDPGELFAHIHGPNTVNKPHKHSILHDSNRPLYLFVPH